MIVFDPEQGSALYSRGFFGLPLGIRKPKRFEFDRPLELSLCETRYLMEKGEITLKDLASGDTVPLEEFVDRARQVDSRFDARYDVYADLRDKGKVVRSGLKFGADFAVYRKGPGIDHSPYIVQVMERDSHITSVDMVRAGRLATSVKKRFVIANPTTKTYYAFRWIRP